MPLTRLVVLGVSVALSAAAAIQVPLTAAAADMAAVVSDAFSRSVTAGWGTADKGGTYTLSGPSTDFGVANGMATAVLSSPGANRAGFLNSLSRRDVQMTFKARVSAQPAGGPVTVFAELRAQHSSSVRPKLLFQPDGTLGLQVGLVQAGRESAMSGPYRTNIAYTPGRFVWLRVSVTGAYPTTVRASAWLDGLAAPTDWQLTTSTSASSAQVAGAVGLRTYLSAASTSSNMSVDFDVLNVLTSDTSAPTATPSPPPVVIVGAGDISSCRGSGDAQTANVVSGIAGTVFTLGDNAYESGTAAEFANCYGPTWGAFKSRTRPVIGNHEYDSPYAEPYFGYFGSGAGSPDQGWYAYSVGAWRVYALNSNCRIVGCSYGSAQEQWFKQDLAAHPQKCTVVMWHHPRYSSGSEHGSNTGVQPLWRDAYDAGVEIVLSGHDHDYERFAPMNATGELDTARGLREFVVGTGGAELRALSSTILPNSQVRQASTYGVLRLDLGSGTYHWQFVPVAGGTFGDSGSGTCH